jgi:hypothetical protein
MGGHIRAARHPVGGRKVGTRGWAISAGRSVRRRLGTTVVPDRLLGDAEFHRRSAAHLVAPPSFIPLIEGECDEG